MAADQVVDEINCRKLPMRDKVQPIFPPRKLVERRIIKRPHRDSN